MDSWAAPEYRENRIVRGALRRGNSLVDLPWEQGNGWASGGGKDKPDLSSGSFDIKVIFEPEWRILAARTSRGAVSKGHCGKTILAKKEVRT